jgi:diacylglycerol O-acyltransferase / wax synthase
MTIKQLSPQDAQFLYIQTASSLTHIMGVYIFDPSTAPGGKVRFKDIIKHIASRVDSSPVFKRRLYRLPMDVDHPYWVEDEYFDVEAHMLHSRLPEPGDWRQFCILTARHFSRPMDMNRPLWDIYVVEGLDRIDGVAPGSYAILHRVHHSAIDGVSGAASFVALSDIDAGGNPIVPLPAHREPLGDEPTTAGIVTRAMRANVTSPVKLMNAMLKFAPAVISAAQRSATTRNDGMRGGVPETRFNAAISPHKAFEAAMFPLKQIAEIRQLVLGSTVNDVVLAICSGALRMYMQLHKELPEEPLVAVAPVNARKSNGEADTPGNNISAMSVKLPTHIADPIKRLIAIQSYTKDAKEAKAGLSARIMTDLSKHIPGATMAGVARLLTSKRFAPRQTNLFISNVPGPQFPLFMNGAKLTHQYGLGPLANNMGLFIAALSYNGNISFSITTDRKIMPDVEFFRKCIQASFAELRAALDKPAKATGKPKIKAAAKPKRKSAKAVADARDAAE